MRLEVVWKATPNIAEACRLLADTSEANEQLKLENAKQGNGLQLEAMQWNRPGTGVHPWLFSTSLLLHRHRLPNAIENLRATAVKIAVAKSAPAKSATQ